MRTEIFDSQVPSAHIFLVIELFCKGPPVGILRAARVEANAQLLYHESIGT